MTGLVPVIHPVERNGAGIPIYDFISHGKRHQPAAGELHFGVVGQDKPGHDDDFSPQEQFTHRKMHWVSDSRQRYRKRRPSL
jgi:hypothetical protein